MLLLLRFNSYISLKFTFLKSFTSVISLLLIFKDSNFAKSNSPKNLMLLNKLKLKSNFFKYYNHYFSNTFISIVLLSLKFRISNFSNF